MQKLIKCGWKKSCKVRCKCHTQDLQCTDCVDEMGNDEKEVLPEIVCEWHFKHLPISNTYKLKILVNL